MNKSGVARQVINHPKGGGAISALGETFSPDLHTGTGNVTVPITLPPGRSKLQPDLSLTYSSGRGNGLFGLGWALSTPGITRDTTRGLPLYSDPEDSFLLSGVEQLIPTRRSSDGGMIYRPRTEGTFARIKHFTTLHDDYWEVRSRNGSKSLYGHPGLRTLDTAVVRDPDDTRRVFSWYLTETSDPFGNRIEYLYEREPVAEDGPHRWDQIYLKTIRYADYGSREAPQFLVTVDFAYDSRPDPFSNYRSGFEIRTTRRCTKIEVRTHADVTRLTRVYHFTYDDQLRTDATPTNGVSLLRQIDVEGADDNDRERFPPLEFGYTSFEPSHRFYEPMSAIGGVVPDRSLTHPDFELADLFGGGLADVVQINGAGRYWRNLGGGCFDVPRPLEGVPAGIHLGHHGVQLADFDGDGHIDLLVSERGLSGYFPLTAMSDGETEPFVSDRAAPPSLDDSELRLVDLNGDGITDALRTGVQFELYFHDRDLGWTDGELRSRDDFDRFPDVYFSDPRVKLADMSGDGLQDVVFINGSGVDYWPYLGGGRWGQRVRMLGDVEFSDALAEGGLGFDPKRLLMGDVDGDGLADLVYVESGRVTLWLNQSGNSWSSPVIINGTPPVADIDAVRLADMLGHGTDGILWTYDYQRLADNAYKFLDLTGGLKPYLLNERDNHAGARTLVEYVPSTYFYVEDERLPSTRWQGRLPFPVQVVARVEVIDELSGGKMTSEYRYHQGYWDGDEREFRGFGMVEQLDTETFARYSSRGLHGAQEFNAVDEVSFSPPTLTRTWFHQGQVQDRKGIWRESGIGSTSWAGDPALFSPDQRAGLTTIARTAASNADPERVRHALRSLRGSALRSELYALDDSPNQDRPYTVTESLYDVREVEPDDPGAEDRLRIFFPFQTAIRTTQWERGSDPMTKFVFTEHDEYGLPRTELEVAVPRARDPSVDVATPTEPYLSMWSVIEYARRDDLERYLVDRIAGTTAYQVLNDGRQSVFALRDAVIAGSGELRMVGHERTFYDGEAFVGRPYGQIGDFGMPVRSEALVFTEEFLDVFFDSADPRAVGPRPVYLAAAGVDTWPSEYPGEFKQQTPDLAGYVYHADGDLSGSPPGYYAPGDRHMYDFHDPGRTPRGLLLIMRDPLGADVTIDYDDYEVLPVRITDPFGLVTSAKYDYRVFQTREITDANGNSVHFAFSPAGFVSARYVRGENGEGDIESPSVRMQYDLLAFERRGEPIFVRSIRRAHHDSDMDVPSEQRDDTIESVEYSDGFGRLVQTRTQAEDTLFGDAMFGNDVISGDQTVAIAAASGRTRSEGDPPNVVVSGWQVFDNKGRVVEKYEPTFDKSWEFHRPTDAELGEKVVMFYDPRSRVVRTLNPDGSEQIVVYGIPSDLADPSDYSPTNWESYTYDANDNAGRTHPTSTTAFSSHWNTSSSIVVDALGRTITTIARNGPDSVDDWHVVHATYDIHGNLLAATDALGRVAFSYAYDLGNRRWRVDSLDAGRRDTVPDVLGNPIEARDSKGALVLQSYDVLHRPMRIWARDAFSSPVTLRQRLEYGDEWADRAAARNKNLLGQVWRHHDEAGLTTVASVDFKGNVLVKFRRVIADAPLLALFSDALTNDWRVKQFQVDWQPISGESLVDREEVLLEATEYRTSASYDALNRLKRMQLPRDVEGGHRTVLPTYNRAGRLDRVSLDDVAYIDCIAYDAKGRRTLVAYSNGVVTRCAYDPQTFRLKRLRSEQCTQPDAYTYAPSGQVLQDFGYEYDLVGNILTIQDCAPRSGILSNPAALTASDPILGQLLVSGDALTRRFAYDPLYRLLSATGRESGSAPQGPQWLSMPRPDDMTKARAYREQYAYDAVGNIARLEHRNGSGGFIRSFALEAETNRLLSMQSGQSSFAYVCDANGNVCSETTSRHFEWNHADEMRAFRTQTDGAEPSVYAHYLYDATGQRVKKLVRKQGGQLEVTHYIDAVFEHHRASSVVVTHENNYIHVMDDKERVSLVRVGPPRSDDATPSVQFQLADHLGSSNAVVDQSGSLINREEFTPYGETSFGSFAKKRYRFTGRERDEESGLNYHARRYYSAPLGRWMSADPHGPVDGLNVFTYAGCNPIVFSDTSGTDKNLDEAGGRIYNDDGTPAQPHWKDYFMTHTEPDWGHDWRGNQQLKERVQNSLNEAHLAYEQTGQLWPSTSFAPIEIATGQLMTRSERYDALMLSQKHDPTNINLADVDRDPFFVTKDEFFAEHKVRVSSARRELKACGQSRPSHYQCRDKVYAQYTHDASLNQAQVHMRHAPLRRDPVVDRSVQLRSTANKLALVLPVLEGPTTGALGFVFADRVLHLDLKASVAFGQFVGSFERLYSAHRTALSGATISSTGSLENLGPVFQGESRVKESQREWIWTQVERNWRGWRGN